MSWQTSWTLAAMPGIDEVSAHAHAVADLAGLDRPTVTLGDNGVIGVQFSVAVAHAVDVPHKLGLDRSREDILSDLDPPQVRVDEKALAAAGLLAHEEIDGELETLYLPGWEAYEHVPDHYVVFIEVMPSSPEADEDTPAVLVYSSSDDNRAAWPVAHDLGLVLAEKLGIVEDEDGPEAADDPPNDDELN